MRFKWIHFSPETLGTLNPKGPLWGPSGGPLGAPQGGPGVLCGARALEVHSVQRLLAAASYMLLLLVVLAAAS